MKNVIPILFLFTASFLLAPQVLAVTPKTTISAVAAPKVEYILPYPGILPDHPLYFLKQVRDKILDSLIVDPLRKIEFYILQADKRLGMGAMLTQTGKDKLAETTISKGEKYLNLAVTLVTSLKASGRPIPGNVLDRLERSIAKHIEVLEELITKANDAQKSALTGSLNLVKKLQQDLAKLK